MCIRDRCTAVRLVVAHDVALDHAAQAGDHVAIAVGNAHHALDHVILFQDAGAQRAAIARRRELEVDLNRTARVREVQDGFTLGRHDALDTGQLVDAVIVVAEVFVTVVADEDLSLIHISWLCTWYSNCRYTLVLGSMAGSSAGFGTCPLGPWHRGAAFGWALPPDQA